LYLRLLYIKYTGARENDFTAGGQVFVDGAEPGDTLQVEVLDMRSADWGWTSRGR
jgi:acetamidase/formamidase